MNMVINIIDHDWISGGQNLISVNNFCFSKRLMLGAVVGYKRTQTELGNVMRCRVQQ